MDLEKYNPSVHHYVRSDRSFREFVPQPSHYHLYHPHSTRGFERDLRSIEGKETDVGVCGAHGSYLLAEYLDATSIHGSSVPRLEFLPQRFRTHDYRVGTIPPVQGFDEEGKPK